MNQYHCQHFHPQIVFCQTEVQIINYQLLQVAKMVHRVVNVHIILVIIMGLQLQIHIFICLQINIFLLTIHRHHRLHHQLMFIRIQCIQICIRINTDYGSHSNECKRFKDKECISIKG